MGARPEPDLAEPRHDLAKGDAQVHPGEIGADAAVRPGAERDVAVLGAAEFRMIANVYSLCYVTVHG
jgi:hypothetical protein